MPATTEGLLLLRVIGATGAAALGASIALPVKRTSHRLLCAMVSFAAGGLFGVTAQHIVPETVHLAGPLQAGGALAAGLALFWAVGRYLYFVCPACSASHLEGGYLKLGWLMIATMTLHSLTDGIAITAGHEAGLRSGTALGALIFLAVSYHKVPEGLALMGVARMAGMSALRAFSITLLVELTTGLGALVGLLLSGMGETAMGVLLGLVGGSFLYVVLFAILKEMWIHEKASVLAFASLGALSIVAAGFLIHPAASHG